MAGTRSSTGRGSKGSRPTDRSRPGDSTLRNEITGIALSALALVLFIAVVWETDSLIPKAVAAVLESGFGVGAYFVPLFILVWGVTFFFPRLDIDEAGVGLGLTLAFVSIIAMIAVVAPEATYWERATVSVRGGYLGAAVAWLFESLLGAVISYVVLAAALLIGIVIATGVSVADQFRRVTGSLRREDEPADVSPRRRAAKTLALEDVPDAPDLAPERPKSEPKKRERRAPDPEARRKTLPTTATAATPTAMEGFELPDPGFLHLSPKQASAQRASERELKATAELIEQTLATFDISSKVMTWTPGPTVTMYEVKIAQGVKVGRVTSLADDIALALAAPTIRILAPIPGKSLIGIEVPNSQRTTITLGDVLSDAEGTDGGPLVLGIGKDVAGDSVVADLAAMPHLLIAGATGTGKSVAINAMLMSILMRATPAEVRLILIDPKRIELNLYNDVPHLYVPVVTEAKEAASALHWSVGEMESRLKRLQKAGARNISMYNAMVQAGTAPESAEEMSYLVIVIDELADLMMVAAKEVEDSICRLAQLARAAGIHLVVATQRPSTDIITGLIKTNITHRIAFAVSSGIDSRVILDTAGAENLVGQGDMLFATPAWPKPRRLQGALVTEQEIEAVAKRLREQAEPDFHEEILHLKVTTASGGGVAGGEDDDPLLWEAADIIVTSGMGSTSMLQRRLKVGYARAGRIMDMLEGKGVVGPPHGSKPREVLVDIESLESLKAFEAADAETAD
jgi:S-DNA-T family DNA segregation ATPase FtsK/SpoIIIE